MGSFSESLQDCARALDLDPEDPAPYDTMARIKLDSGDAEGALELALEGQDIAPEYPDIYDIIARCYEALGKKNKAKQARAKAVKLGFVDED